MTGPIHEETRNHLVVSEIEAVFLDACLERNETPDSQIASELKSIILTLYATGVDERRPLSEFADIYFSLRAGS